MKERKDIGLIVALVFVSAVVSGSLVFWGMQMGGAGLGDAALAQRIEKGIDEYIAKKTVEAEQDQVAAAAQAAEQTKEMAQNVPPVDKAADHIFGNADAKISLIEYSDFQCPYCHRFHPTAKELLAANNGNVNWIYRHFPLSGHEPTATRQAVGIECVAELAGNDAFWKMADLYFTPTGPSDDVGILAAAVGLGVNESAFNQCIASQKHLPRIQSDLASGTLAGVRGTPGNILLNNETGEAILIEGAQPAAVFQTAIDSMLKNEN